MKLREENGVHSKIRGGDLETESSHCQGPMAGPRVA